MPNKYSQTREGLVTAPISVEDYSRAGLIEAQAQGKLAGFTTTDLSFNVDEEDQAFLDEAIAPLEEGISNLTEQIAQGTTNIDSYREAIKYKRMKNNLFGQQGDVQVAQRNLAAKRVGMENISKMAVTNNWTADRLKAVKEINQQAWVAQGGTFNEDGTTNSFEVNYGPGNADFTKHMDDIYSKAAQNLTEYDTQYFNDKDFNIIYDEAGIIFQNTKRGTKSNNIKQLEAALNMLVNELDDPNNLYGSHVDFFGSNDTDKAQMKADLIDYYMSGMNMYTQHKSTPSQVSSSLHPYSTSSNGDGDYDGASITPLSPTDKDVNVGKNVAAKGGLLYASNLYANSDTASGGSIMVEGEQGREMQNEELARTAAKEEMFNPARMSFLRSRKFPVKTEADFWDEGMESLVEVDAAGDPVKKRVFLDDAFKNYIKEATDFYAETFTVSITKTVDTQGNDPSIVGYKNKGKVDAKVQAERDMNGIYAGGKYDVKGVKVQMSDGNTMTLKEIRNEANEPNASLTKMGYTTPNFLYAEEKDGFKKEHLQQNVYSLNYADGTSKIFFLDQRPSDQGGMKKERFAYETEEALSEIDYIEPTNTVVAYKTVVNRNGKPVEETHFRDADLVRANDGDYKKHKQELTTGLMRLDYSSAEAKRTGIPDRIPVQSWEIRNSYLLKLKRVKNGWPSDMSFSEIQKLGAEAGAEMGDIIYDKPTSTTEY